MTPDWGAGRYETFAEKLLPAARVVVERAAPVAGERVVDVGCGTGNAALLAAERGARVTGVDPAARLLAVAEQRAHARGLSADFALGHAAALPLDDGEADLVLSVFGASFAPDARAAAAELARVTAPGGRIVLGVWHPDGQLAHTARLAREALGTPPEPRRFAWHERDALAGLLAPYGFDVAAEPASVRFTAESPRAFLELEATDHPMVIAARRSVEPLGGGEALTERVLEHYAAVNEDPDAFLLTIPYVIAIARR